MKHLKFNYIIALVVLIGLYACNNSDKKDRLATETSIDTATKETAFRYLKTDYPERVFAFKRMSDSTGEQQVVKYERFSVLFIEYVSIYKNQPLYSPDDQENNTEAYNILRDEMVSLKVKLKKNVTLLSKNQEQRLDVADANMNKFLPSVYK